MLVLVDGRVALFWAGDKGESLAFHFAVSLFVFLLSW